MSAAFSTELLDRVVRRKREQAEELRLLTLERLKCALGSLPVSFDSVVVFGSVATPGRFRERSDIDVALAGLADEDYFAAKRYLESELCRDVDVIQLEGHRLREAALRGGIRWSRKELPSSAPR